MNESVRNAISYWFKIDQVAFTLSTNIALICAENTMKWCTLNLSSPVFIGPAVSMIRKSIIHAHLCPWPLLGQLQQTEHFVTRKSNKCEIDLYLFTLCLNRFGNTIEYMHYFTFFPI